MLPLRARHLDLGAILRGSRHLAAQRRAQTGARKRDPDPRTIREAAPTAHAARSRAYRIPPGIVEK